MKKYVLFALLLVCLSMAFGDVTPPYKTSDIIMRNATTKALLNGTYSLNYTLYSGSSHIWTETVTTYVTNGIANNILGLTSPLNYSLFLNAKPITMNISVSGNTSLGYNITSIPFAWVCEFAQNVNTTLMNTTIYDLMNIYAYNKTQINAMFTALPNMTSTQVNTSIYTIFGAIGYNQSIINALFAALPNLTSTNVNTSIDDRLHNITVARVGNCTGDQVVQNTTTGGVQCVDRDKASTTYYPSAVNTTGGQNTTSNISYMYYYDSDVYNISEGTGANPLDFYINYTSVVNFTQFVIREYYTGSTSHNINIEFYDYTSSAWESYFSFTGQSNYTQVQIPVYDGSTNHLSGGVVRVRLHHVENGISSHRLHIDFAWLIDGSIAVSSTNLQGYAKYDFQYHNFTGSGNITTDLGFFNGKWNNSIFYQPISEMLYYANVSNPRLYYWRNTSGVLSINITSTGNIDSINVTKINATSVNATQANFGLTNVSALNVSNANITLVNVTNITFNKNSGHLGYDNTTCIIFRGNTAELSIC